MADVEDSSDRTRLGRARALTDAEQRAQLAAVHVGRLRRIEQVIDGADGVHRPTRPGVTVPSHEWRRPLARHQFAGERRLLVRQVCAADRVGEADDRVKAPA